MPSYWCVDTEEGYSTHPRSERQTAGPGLTEENYYYSLGSNSSISSGDNNFLFGIFGLSASRDSSSASGVPERLSISDGNGIVHSWTLEQYVRGMYN